MEETNILVYGKFPGKKSGSIVKKNGQAYLEGWATWAELGCYFSKGACTQPEKMYQETLRFDPFERKTYKSEIKPLLNQMEKTFTEISNNISQISKIIPDYLKVLWVDFESTSNVTKYRAIQIKNLYEYVGTWLEKPDSERAIFLDKAKTALSMAETTIRSQEKRYKVPLARIASWQDNPTSYSFGYLWTVKSLFYFWRDFSQSVDNAIDDISPCFMNLMNPIDIIFGEGIYLNATEVAREVIDRLGFGEFFGNCLAAPKKEPHYPIS